MRVRVHQTKLAAPGAFCSEQIIALNEIAHSTIAQVDILRRSKNPTYSIESSMSALPPKADVALPFRAARCWRPPLAMSLLTEQLLHYAQDDLPFGGVGLSGMGAYHGIELPQIQVSWSGVLTDVLQGNPVKETAPGRSSSRLAR